MTDQDSLFQRAIVAQLIKEATGATSPTAKATNLRALSEVAARLDRREDEKQLQGLLRPDPAENLETVSQYQQRQLAALENLAIKFDRARRMTESDPVLVGNPDQEGKTMITLLFGSLKELTTPAVYHQIQQRYGDEGLTYLATAMAAYARAELTAELETSGGGERG